MTRALDELFDELRDPAPDRRLAVLEHHVWRQIKGSRRLDGFLQGSLIRAAAVAVAVAVGATVGGMSAASAAANPSEIAVFSVHSTLAPSTILDVQS